MIGIGDTFRVESTSTPAGARLRVLLAGCEGATCDGCGTPTDETTRTLLDRHEVEQAIEAMQGWLRGEHL